MWNDSPGKSYHRIKSSAWLRRVVILLPYHPCGWIRDFVVESSCQGFGEWAKTVGNLGWPDIDGGSSLGSDPWLRTGCKSLIQQMNDIQGWHGYNQGLCFWTFWLACFRKVIAPAMRTGDASFLQKLGQKFCKTSFQSFFLSNHFFLCHILCCFYSLFTIGKRLQHCFSYHLTWSCEGALRAPWYWRIFRKDSQSCLSGEMPRAFKSFCHGRSDLVEMLSGWIRAQVDTFEMLQLVDIFEEDLET